MYGALHGGSGDATKGEDEERSEGFKEHHRDKKRPGDVEDNNEKLGGG